MRLWRIRRRKREEPRPADESARLDAGITELGERLGAHSFTPGPDTADEPLALYRAALDTYEAAARHAARQAPRAALIALEDGRHALDRLDALLAGEPAPEQRPLCFFDPRHGPAVREVPWAPQDGAARPVPVCAADAVRLEDGEQPLLPARQDAAPRTRTPLRRRAAPRPADPPARAGRPGAPVRLTGEHTVWLRLPDPGRPALLALHPTSDQPWITVRIAGRAVPVCPYNGGLVPVPAASTGIDGTRLVVTAGGEYLAWTEPVTAIRQLAADDGCVEGSGSTLLRTGPTTERATITHLGGGEFSVDVLDHALDPVEPLVRGGEGGGTVHVVLPADAPLMITAATSWNITLPDRTGPTARTHYAYVGPPVTTAPGPAPTRPLPQTLGIAAPSAPGGESTPAPA